MLTLLSKESKEYKIERDVISLSIVISNLIMIGEEDELTQEDMDKQESDPIPIEATNYELEKIIEFCRIYKSNPFNIPDKSECPSYSQGALLTKGYAVYQTDITRYVPKWCVDYIKQIPRRDLINICDISNKYYIYPLLHLLALHLATLCVPFVDNRKVSEIEECRRKIEVDKIFFRPFGEYKPCDECLVKYPDPEIAEYKPCETCTNSWKEIIEAKKNVFRAEAAEYLKKVIEEKEAKAAETKANEEIAEYKPCETCTNSWKEIIEDKKNVFGAEAAEYLKKVIEEKEAKAAETKAAEAKAAETKANE